MNDSFKNRVEKIFGSLQSSQYSSLQQRQRPPLWSLTDDEVERREWRRESAADREETFCSSSFQEFLKEERKYRSGGLSRKELKDDLDNYDNGDDDDDNDDGDCSQSRSRRFDGDGDEWKIRSCLGMDSTLDNEEEEDEYDKVASGRENAGERLYMSDIADHGSFLNYQNVHQNHTSNKDRHANHRAARIKLKEDEEEARRLNYYDMSNAEIKDSNVKASDNGCQLRSILKRKDSGTGFKPQKRVRFDPVCKSDLKEPSEKFEEYPTGTLPMDYQDSDCGYLPAENARALPDYIRNPSRYTCYSFDSSTSVEEPNAQACLDFLKVVQNSKSEESLSELEDAPRDLPMPVTFIPKRKSGDVQLGSGWDEVKVKEDECKLLRPTRLPVGIVAGTNLHSEYVATEDDEPETSAADSTVIRKGDRSYRVKSKLDD